MKILVPTDFSVFAQTASSVALELATLRNGSVHWLHCADLPEGWENWPLREQDLDPEAQQKYRKSLGKLKQLADASPQNIPCTYEVRSGKIYEAVDACYRSQDFDLIIMGTHGISGKQEYFVGSNTQKVIRKVHANILILKDTHHHIEFDQILFATGLSVDDRTMFRDFLTFIRPFNPSKIHILSIDTPGFFTQPTIVMQEGLKDFVAIGKKFGYDCQSHYLRDFTVEAGIRHFSDQVGVDLVAISNHERHPIRRTFRGSTVELLANHANVPVLSLDRISHK